MELRGATDVSHDSKLLGVASMSALRDPCWADGCGDTVQYAEILASCEHEPTTIFADCDLNEIVQRRCVLWRRGCASRLRREPPLTCGWGEVTMQGEHAAGEAAARRPVHPHRSPGTAGASRMHDSYSSFVDRCGRRRSALPRISPFSLERVGKQLGGVVVDEAGREATAT
jgi:hypothetical protein